ncbi:MAG TPA: class I SAM-dependent methyltransferase [Candidatus Krumholzibacteria bacterium]|nr:class I SAM-dependent methyltransferase [Candidatus Krumholzibacteria bacterium]
MTNPDNQPRPGAGSVTEAQVQDFWTTFPMVYGAGTTPEMLFEDMERVLRDQYRHLQGPDEPLLARLLDYSAFKGKPVLEIGFGTGWLMNELVRAGARVHGIDLSRSHEALCRHRFRNSDVKLQIASAESIPYPDNTFDLVAAWGVLHHAADDARCYAEVQRVLKPGGRAFLMLYRRAGAKYYYQNIFRKGVLGGGLIRHGFNIDAFIRSVTDKYSDDSPGAPISRHYTEPELRRLLSHFSKVDLRITGSRAEFSEIPLSHLPISDWVLSDERRAALLRRHGGFWVVDAVK